jgi:hypothetical protein
MPNLLDLPAEIVSEIVDHYFEPETGSYTWSNPSRRRTTFHIAVLSSQFYKAMQRKLLRDDVSLSLYREDGFQRGGDGFIRSVRENPVFASKIRSIQLKIYPTFPVEVNEVVNDANFVLEKLINLQKMRIVSQYSKIPFPPRFVETNPLYALTEVSLDDTQLRVETIAEFMFLENIKTMKIAHISNLYMARLPRKFVGRVSPLENLELDPTFHFRSPERVLVEMLKWPKNLRHICCPLPADRSGGEGRERSVLSAANLEHILLSAEDCLEELELIEHGRPWQTYSHSNMDFSRLKVLKMLCCPIQCLAPPDSRTCTTVVPEIYKLLPRSLEILQV